jgi:hypothetical protein
MSRGEGTKFIDESHDGDLCIGGLVVLNDGVPIAIGACRQIHLFTDCCWQRLRLGGTNGGRHSEWR